MPRQRGRLVGTGELAAYVGFFQELVAQDPDITLFEPRDALADAESVTVHLSAIAGLLKRLGFTHKKKSLVAAERRRAKIMRQRQDWFALRMSAITDLSEHIVLLNETAVRTNLTRMRGICQGGSDPRSRTRYGDYSR